MDGLKLTVYSGERDRAGGRLLSDALVEAFASAGVRASAVLRGIEGFGVKHHLHSARLLTLSEDLPMVTVAVDAAERIAPLAERAVALAGDGLVTVERARLSGEGAGQLTAWVGRHERVGGRPAHRAAVAALRRCGAAGATVLVGVDGTLHGSRRRAAFLGRNAQVPAMVVGVGEPAAIAEAAAELERLLERPLVTHERVVVCKRDGLSLAALPELPDADRDGLWLWQKLSVHASEQARHDGRPLHAELVRRLRGAGCAGATALRGAWGYHGDHPPHGDRLWELRRRVPLLTVVVDRPSRMREWFAIVDEATGEAGLVTSEIVPAARAAGPGIERGGLRLARP